MYAGVSGLSIPGARIFRDKLMPNLQELNNTQIHEVLSVGFQRRIPSTITVRTNSKWLNLRSRLVQLHNEQLLLEFPSSDDTPEPHEFVPAEKIGLSFKLKHHKYLCAAAVSRIDTITLDDDSKVSVLCITWPSRMHRLQRRAFYRVDVPPGKIVRASFWPGGREAEPSGACPERPVWSGKVTNLSAGGFQVHAGAEAAKFLEAGYVVGVRLAFGAGGDDTVYADAQFRHVQDDSEMSMIGFQFIGLAQTDEGRQALQIITDHVAKFQRYAEKKNHARSR